MSEDAGSEAGKPFPLEFSIKIKSYS